MSPNHCRECLEPIEWGLLAQSAMPVELDLGYQPNGRLAVVGNRSGTPVVRLVPLAEIEVLRDAGVGLRRPHGSTCSSNLAKLGRSADRARFGGRRVK